MVRDLIRGLVACAIYLGGAFATGMLPLTVEAVTTVSVFALGGLAWLAWHLRRYRQAEEKKWLGGRPHDQGRQ